MNWRSVEEVGNALIVTGVVVIVIVILAALGIALLGGWIMILIVLGSPLIIGLIMRIVANIKEDGE